jgi:hypothetical protein
MIIEVKGGSLTEDEKDLYLQHVKKKNPAVRLKTLTIVLDGEYAELYYTYEYPNFERVRRITGYLVGTVDRWNDGKKAELADRVAHD